MHATFDYVFGGMCALINIFGAFFVRVFAI
jgi:hypothetical protein